MEAEGEGVLNNPTVDDPHPIRSAWAEYKRTPEYQTQRLLYSEEAIWAGFRDGWIYGRRRMARPSDEGGDRG